MKRRSIILLVTVVVLAGAVFIFSDRLHLQHRHSAAADPVPARPISRDWVAPDSNLIPNTAEGALIRYGKKLIAHTSLYFGPKGQISQQANGMNCQNCHLEAGTRNYANPFSGVAALYPMYRARSGRIESIEFKINECLERSLNGSKIDSASPEMKSMLAYIKWVGTGVPKGSKPAGAGTDELSPMNRAADSGKGSIVFQLKCQSCHGRDGQGFLNAGQTAYVYPPLWGEHSYNTAAGMYRISKLAGYIKYAMPFGTRYPAAQLSDAEIWDVAAFINSKPHPVKFFKYDWPSLKTKPFDYPFGPYDDSFSEKRHKYGPFALIKEGREALTMGK